jgi:hypothetical protein
LITIDSNSKFNSVNAEKKKQVMNAFPIFLRRRRPRRRPLRRRRPAKLRRRRPRRPRRR